MLYSFSWGINNGLTFYAVSHQAWIWFPDKPGLTSGLIFSGLGGAGFIFGLLSTWMVNPSDIPISDPAFAVAVQANFVPMLHRLIFCWAVIVLAAVALVWQAPLPNSNDPNLTNLSIVDP